MAVAYSAGRDSTALLHATVRMAHELGGIDVVALHVHHGLQPLADDWLAHARSQCDGWSALGWPVSLRWQRLQLKAEAGDSIEAVARQARYAALAAMAREAGCDTVLLAHHRRDQAETFILQALRGAGVAGLAAMPRAVRRDGIQWLRPWLDRPRSAIEAYVQEHALAFVDDGSNQDARFARNRLRLQVWPALSRAFDETEGALAQAASHQADVLACLDDWLADKLPQVTRWIGPSASSLGAQARGGLNVVAGADVVAHAVVDMDAAAMAPPACGCALDVAAWQRWPQGPQRELLRAWFRQVTGRPMPASWVTRLQAEVRPEGTARWPLRLRDPDGAAREGLLGLYRGLLHWHPAPSAPTAPVLPPVWPCPLHITAPGRWPLPHGLGALLIEAVAVGQGGLPLARLRDCELRPRQGGERFQMAMDRPARSLKKQFQMMGVPAWEREGPLLWADGELLYVPGLGIHAPAWADEACAPLVRLHWEPPAGPAAAKE